MHISTSHVRNRQNKTNKQFHYGKEIRSQNKNTLNFCALFLSLSRELNERIYIRASKKKTRCF
jgi:hypothetical protein